MLQNRVNEFLCVAPCGFPVADRLAADFGHLVVLPGTAFIGQLRMARKQTLLFQ